MWLGTKQGNFTVNANEVIIPDIDPERDSYGVPDVDPIEPVLQTKMFVDSPETLMCGKRG